MDKRRSVFIARTAILLAMAIALQFLGLRYLSVLGIGKVLVVGSIVNLILYISVRIVNVYAGIFIGLCTPVMATLLSHAQPITMPFVMIANVVLVVVYFFMLKIKFQKKKAVVEVNAVQDEAVVVESVEGQVVVNDSVDEVVTQNQPEKKCKWGKTQMNMLLDGIAIVVSSVVKFLVMYLCVMTIIPHLAALKPPMVIALQLQWSWPQLVTALIGGAISFVLYHSLKGRIKYIK